MSGRYPTPWETFKSLQEASREESKPTSQPTNQRFNDSAIQREKKGLSWKEKKEYEALEARIGALDARKAEIATEMNMHATDYVRLQKLHEEQEKNEAELETALERWFALEEMKASDLK